MAKHTRSVSTNTGGKIKGSRAQPTNIKRSKNNTGITNRGIAYVAPPAPPTGP